MSTQRNAVILLSGGLDSTTTLAIAKSEGFAPYALTFRYGQRHEHEIDCARQVAARMGVSEWMDTRDQAIAWALDPERIPK